MVCRRSSAAFATTPACSSGVPPVAPLFQLQVSQCSLCSVEHFETSALPRICRARLGHSAWDPAVMLSFLAKLLEWTHIQAAADGLYTLEYVPRLHAVTLTPEQQR